MTDEEGVLAPVPTDAVLQTAQQTGKLPVHWWTSETCWRMLAKLAGQFANSTMVPSAFRNEPGNVIVALAAGMPLGLSPLACLQSVAVINGKPTLYGDAPMAQVLAHPSLVDIEERASGSIEKGDRVWVVQVKRKHAGSVTSTARSFSIADAKRAGLWDKSGPWKSYPDRMLYNRARAYAVRDSFADVLQGVQIAADSTDDTPSVVTVAASQTVVHDSDALTSTVTNSEQVVPAPVEQPKPKRKRKRSELAAETAHAEMQQQANKDALPIEGFTLDTPRAHCVSFDPETGSVLWYGDDERSVVVAPEHPQHAECMQAARDGLTRYCVQKMQSRRMSAEDAGVHVQAVLGLDKPSKLADLSHTQLADLASDLR